MTCRYDGARRKGQETDEHKVTKAATSPIAKEPLGVRLGHIAPLEALEVSAIGVLVEYATAFKPGSLCDVELWRSDQTIRLRGEVVRSIVAGGGGSDTRIRYRAAVQFLETPQTIFALLPELSEEF